MDFLAFNTVGITELERPLILKTRALTVMLLKLETVKQGNKLIHGTEDLVAHIESARSMIREEYQTCLSHSGISVPLSPISDTLHLDFAEQTGKAFIRFY